MKQQDVAHNQKSEIEIGAFPEVSFDEEYLSSMAGNPKPIFDPEAFNRYFGGATKEVGIVIFTKCAEKMLLEMPKQLESLINAYQSGGQSDLNHLAHRLKSSFRTLGGESIAYFLELIESGKISHSKAIAVALRNIETMAAEFSLELAKFLVLLKAGRTKGGQS